MSLAFGSEHLPNFDDLPLAGTALFVLVVKGEYQTAKAALGPKLYTAFSAALSCITIDVGTLEDLFIGYPTANRVLVFVGSYTGYDYTRVLCDLDLRQYRRTGSSFAASCVMNNKELMGHWFAARNLRASYDVTKCQFPCVVKRADSCGSWDQVVCQDQEAIRLALGSLVGKNIVIEPFVAGREFSVNFLGSDLISWWSVHTGADECLTRERKAARESWVTAHDAVDGAPPELPELAETLKAFLVEVDARDVVRFDVRLGDGCIQVMDCNSVACCNFEIFTPRELELYVGWIAASIAELDSVH